jgi:hypothetical protein
MSRCLRGGPYKRNKAKAATLKGCRFGYSSIFWHYLVLSRIQTGRSVCRPRLIG